MVEIEREKLIAPIRKYIDQLACPDQRLTPQVHDLGDSETGKTGLEMREGVVDHQPSGYGHRKTLASLMELPRERPPRCPVPKEEEFVRFALQFVRRFRSATPLEIGRGGTGIYPGLKKATDNQ